MGGNAAHTAVAYGQLGGGAPRRRVPCCHAPAARLLDPGCHCCRCCWTHVPLPLTLAACTALYRPPAAGVQPGGARNGPQAGQGGRSVCGDLVRRHRHRCASGEPSLIALFPSLQAAAGALCGKVQAAVALVGQGAAVGCGVAVPRAGASSAHRARPPPAGRCPPGEQGQADRGHVLQLWGGEAGRRCPPGHQALARAAHPASYAHTDTCVCVCVCTRWLTLTLFPFPHPPAALPLLQAL